MKIGLALPDLAAKLQAERSAKKDYIVDTRALTFVPNATTGAFSFAAPDGDVMIPLGDYAFKQVAAHFSIPLTYVDKMRNGTFGEPDRKTGQRRLLVSAAPDLLATNVNHWLANQASKRMIRTFRGLGPTDVVRAFLSDSYRPMDNWDLADAVLPVLIESGAEVKSCEVTETRLYIIAVSPMLQEDLLKFANPDTVGKMNSYQYIHDGAATGRDIVQAGVCISNSEVGAGALKVEPVLYRMACTNGLISGFAISRNHVGRRNGGGGDGDLEGASEYFSDETREADDKALWLKVRDTVKAGFNQAQFEKLVSKFGESLNVSLGSEPAKIVEVTAKRFGLAETEGKSVLENLLSDRVGRQMVTQFDVVNAFTRTAEDLESYDRSVEIMRIGGQVLELKPTDFSAN